MPAPLTLPDGLTQRPLVAAAAAVTAVIAAGKERGATAFALSTDSRTGALGLYEKVGMVATSVWLNRAIEVS